MSQGGKLRAPESVAGQTVHVPSTTALLQDLSSCAQGWCAVVGNEMIPMKGWRQWNYELCSSKNYGRKVQNKVVSECDVVFLRHNTIAEDWPSPTLAEKLGWECHPVVALRRGHWEYHYCLMYPSTTQTPQNPAASWSLWEGCQVSLVVGTQNEIKKTNISCTHLCGQGYPPTSVWYPGNWIFLHQTKGREGWICNTSDHV